MMNLLLQVNDWLVTLVEGMPEDLFRYKGFLAIHGEEERYIFQARSLCELLFCLIAIP